MGNGTWASVATRSAYADVTASYVGKSRDEIFTQHNGIHKLFDPKGITVRESCDSDDNPNSTAIILGLDVTGSMGFVAEEIARRGLGPLIEGIHEKKPVTDPHIMVMALGDIFMDRGPVQASQFEADIRIIEQLTHLWLEGGGGGNGFESYDMAWLFAALKTKIDCFDKRGVKGKLFTIGDEPPPPNSTKADAYQLERVFGEKFERGYTSAEMLEMAQLRYTCFHVLLEGVGHMNGAGKDRCKAQWAELMGPNLILCNDYKKLPEVIVAVMQVSEGADIDDVITQAPTEARDAVAYTLNAARIQ